MKFSFVGGSRMISRLNDEVRERLDNMISTGTHVLIGDANGVDKVIQAHFAEACYRKLTVYFSGSSARNNLGLWPTQQVAPRSKKKDFFFYMAKDLAMADKADCAFMLWDGKSKGTLNNILNLLERRKMAVVYFAPAKLCLNIEKVEDLKPMLDQCDPESLQDFDQKINLHSRIIGGQQSFNLGP